MLQGPLGPFFGRLAKDLHRAGAEVHRVNFNGGDWLFGLCGSWHRTTNFTGSMDEWPAFFRELLDHLQVDCVLLFGDCRPVHVAAVSIARTRGVQVGVFEEGYLRPDYITLERGGVNNRSSLPDQPAFYLSQSFTAPAATEKVGSTFGMAAAWGILYYVAATLGKPVFRNYWHHRRLGILEGLYWIRSFVRKFRYRQKEKAISQALMQEPCLPFFLVPLQTCGDAQIKVHSRFRSIPRFIEHVIHSFAHYAPPGCSLVIKHHPLDRGYTDYATLIGDLARKYDLAARCHYIHDQHLPSLLRNALGVVVVNSTVGLSAVGEGAPVKVCGKAIYDIAGLTFQGELDSFWKGALSFSPDMRLWKAFRSYLIARTQFNGSFYRRLGSSGFQSGIAWCVEPSEDDFKATLPIPDRADPFAELPPISACAVESTPPMLESLLSPASVE